MQMELRTAFHSSFPKLLDNKVADPSRILPNCQKTTLTTCFCSNTILRMGINARADAKKRKKRVALLVQNIFALHTLASVYPAALLV